MSTSGTQRYRNDSITRTDADSYSGHQT